MVILRKQEKKQQNSGKLVGDLKILAESQSQYKIGIAVDIGTTTIAMSIVSIRESKILRELTQTNEQTKLGADVMLRIMNAISGKASQLHQIVIAQIEQMAEELLAECEEKYSSVKQEEIVFSIVGNTTMCHLFLGKDVKGLAGYPFLASYEGNVVCKGKQVGMQRFSQSEIKILTGIAGHVGSDATAVIGAEQLYAPDKVQLAVDLGTNAEIILNKRGNVSVCSAAAGPAFEGKGVSCGMAAKSGAINGVRIVKSNGNIVLEIIDDTQPIGICGSGLIDVVAQLRRCNILRKDGYLLSEKEAETQHIHRELSLRLVVREKMNAFLLYSDEITKKEIYITQQDIRNIQLAKAAIQAGIQSLLSVNNILLEEVDKVIIAGVLGSCLRPMNAIDIGVLPNVTDKKMTFAGNAAGRGAILNLLEEGFAEEMEKTVKNVSHVELAQEESFQGILMQAMSMAAWT